MHLPVVQFRNYMVHGGSTHLVLFKYYKYNFICNGNITPNKSLFNESGQPGRQHDKMTHPSHFNPQPQTAALRPYPGGRRMTSLAVRQHIVQRCGCWPLVSVVHVLRWMFLSCQSSELKEISKFNGEYYFVIAVVCGSCYLGIVIGIMLMVS